MIEGTVKEMGELTEFEMLPPKALYVAVYSFYEDLSYWSAMADMDKNRLLSNLSTTTSKYYGVRIYSIPV